MIVAPASAEERLAFSFAQVSAQHPGANLGHRLVFGPRPFRGSLSRIFPGVAQLPTRLCRSKIPHKQAAER